jgi:hypothetical protein
MDGIVNCLTSQTAPCPFPGQFLTIANRTWNEAQKRPLPGQLVHGHERPEWWPAYY